MNVSRLDSLVRSLGEAPTRRGLLGGISATALVLATTRLPIEAEAKKHKKHKKKKHKKQPATPVTKADATCVGPATDGISIADVNARLAQTFTAIASGPLVKAEVRVIEPPGTLGDYILRLSPVDGAGVPTNIVLAETPLLDVNVPNGQSTATFTFA